MKPLLLLGSALLCRAFALVFAFAGPPAAADAGAVGAADVEGAVWSGIRREGVGADVRGVGVEVRGVGAVRGADAATGADVSGVDAVKGADVRGVDVRGADVRGVLEVGHH